MSFVPLVLLALGAVVAWLAGFLVRAFAPRWGLVDVPHGRKDHKAPTPLGGGLAIAAGVLASLIAFAVTARALGETGSETKPGPAWDNSLEAIRQMTGGVLYAWDILAGAGLVFAIGLADDLRGLGWKLRLIVQCVAAAAVVLGLIASRTLTPLALVLEVALPTLWIVSLVNSMNMLDNMDGLAGGVTVICGVCLAVSLPVTDGPGPLPGVGILLWALAGGALGFLWHNFPPARLFMGDAGSYQAGFLLGSLSALAASRAGGAWPAALAPLLVFAVPMYDLLSVLAIRLRAGRSPFAADHSHVSHRLVALGLTRPQAVLAICAATAVTGGMAIALSRAGDGLAPRILVGMVAIVALAAVGELVAHHRRGAAPVHDRS